MTCCPEDSDSVDGQKPRLRECTDVVCLWIFIFFWILLVLIACFAFVYGNPLRLINDYDSFGNICESEENDKLSDFKLSGAEMSGKKFLFFMDFENVEQSLQICVEKCPDRDLLTLQDIENFYNRTGSLLCLYDFDFHAPRNLSIPVNSAIGPCPKLPVYKSTPTLKWCVPDVQVDIGTYLLNQGWNWIDVILGDLYKSWRSILYLIAFSVVLSLLVVSVLYLFANIVSWAIMMSVSAMSIIGTALLWWTYYDIKCRLDSVPDNHLLYEDINNEEAFKIYSIVATVITLVLLLLVFSVRKRVSFLVALFQEASNCLAELPSLYLLPIISFVLLVGFYIFWISVVVCLTTAGYPESKNLKLFTLFATSGAPFGGSTDEIANSKPLSVNVDSKSFTTVEYIENIWLKYMLFVYLVGLVWISEFILASQHMIVAGSVAKWYFNRTRKSSGALVLTSFGTLMCYHVGSVALGSFLITLFKIPRIILTYLFNKFRRNKEESQCARCSLKCCNCCFYMLERFIRYMNHNAYTIVAIQDINFCPAAYRAWRVLADNTLRLASINSIGNFVLFLGKCFVTVATTSAAILVFKYDSDLNFYAGPTLIISIFAYFIAHSMISLYELVIDTLFLCICEDQKTNGDAGLWKTTLLASIERSGMKPRHIQPPTEL